MLTLLFYHHLDCIIKKKIGKKCLSCTKLTILQCKDLAEPCSQLSLCQSQLPFEVYNYIELKHGPCLSPQLVYESTPRGYKKNMLEIADWKISQKNFIYSYINLSFLNSSISLECGAWVINVNRSPFKIR